MNETIPGEKWDLEIRAKESILNLHLRDAWEYRDLLWLLVRRDFVSVYKQTLLGPLWFFIQPIFTTVIFAVIFGRLAKIGTNGAPPAVFYLSGIITWSYFADCLTKTSTVFRDNMNLYGKVYFPRLILPLSIICSNFVKFGIQFLLFLVAWLFYFSTGHISTPGMALLLVPLCVFFIALLGLSFGLLVTSLTTRYRDLALAVSFGMQLLMYATPVIYPLTALPGKLRPLISLNPMSGLIEAFRYGFFGYGEFPLSAFVYSLTLAVVLFFVSLAVFNRVEKNFVDSI